jgi:4-aminobutyrate aminotransferase
MPFAGIIAKESLNVLQHRSVGHYTHEKNPLCSTAGLATINYIDNQNLIYNAAEKGTYLINRFEELQTQFPVIGNVAGKGLHIGVELVKDLQTKERAVAYAEKVMYYCLRKGVAFKVIEGNILTLRPALTLTHNECDLIVETMKEAFINCKLV